jgi:hypothetical protein
MVAFLPRRIASLALVVMVSTWCQAAPIDERIKKRLAMGEKPNRLIEEKSPYLLQHAFNPVDWYPWGDEAFARAKAEDKPIFLSVGYSTCHWCHVMAHESFESPEIAELLNKWFISVKVDREERPDIDQLYMTATQAMTGGGGWPMSVFLTPDGRPFFAGTYFPPEKRYGRPGFPDILTSLHNAWLQKRSDIDRIAGQMISDIEQNARAGAAEKVNPEILDRAFDTIAEDYDAEHGGFGTAPKFPRPVVLDFLFQHWRRTGREEARDMAMSTLLHMARGGMYDHLGGGFHRYATDRGWREPHFEKMLYDQSQLADMYLDAFLISGERMFADIARDIFGYVLRDMTAPEGGFYSAEDADSEDPYAPGKHGEGAYYLWTAEEINRLLEGRDAGILNFCYGVEPGGNAPEDPQGEFKGKNIVYLAHSIEEAAGRFNMDAGEVRKRLRQAKQVLFAARSERIRPHLDDKIITAWNGLMIGALARGGAILAEPRFLDAAVRAADFIRKEMYREDRTLFRRYRQGADGPAGQLDDYAFLVYGLTELYGATQEPGWLEWAAELTGSMVEQFLDPSGNGFYDSASDSSLPVRMRGYYDGAEPSGNSMAAAALYRMSQLTGNDTWLEMAGRTVRSFSAIMEKYPEALPRMLVAGPLTGDRHRQIVVAGTRGSEDAEALLRAANSVYEPGLVLLFADGGKNQEFLEKHLPFIRGMEMAEDAATAYVCRNFTCRMPVNEADALIRELTEN